MKTFIVLGMHRSATSLTAKALANEIDMGASYRHISDQPRGNWEDLEFYAMNVKILKKAGGNWHEPPLRENILRAGAKLSDEIKALVESKNKKGVLWGWKDPRTALTIELYLPYLINPHYICNFRDPKEVAESLKKRNGFTIDKGIRLALIYNSRIFSFLKKQGFYNIYEEYEK